MTTYCQPSKPNSQPNDLSTGWEKWITPPGLLPLVFRYCIVTFGILAVAGSIYGILVWYPRQRQKKVEALKATGRQGEATILRLPYHELGNYPGRRAVFTRVQIGLEIEVPGIHTYEVDKVFSTDTRAG